MAAVIAVGVPEMTPVVLLMLRPLGRFGAEYEVTDPPVFVGTRFVIGVPNIKLWGVG